MVLISSLFLILAQSPDTSAYLDRDARVLVARARVARDSMESTIQAYTALVKQRVGVALRTPLKDRTLYRSELAAQVQWRRDDANVVKMLGARQFHPGMQYTRENFSRHSLDELFDPNMDRLYFGLTDAEDDDVWIDHPLVDGSEASYRFQTGDTITIGFPDGRQVKVIELRILPRRNVARLVSGSVWIEPLSGAIVKAAYRMPSAINMERDTDVFDNDDDLAHVPGIFKPFELDVTMISVEYSYWRFKHWLPRSLRIEGMARAGILKAPGEMELSYDIQEVFEDGDSIASAGAILRQWQTDEDEVVRQRRNGHRFYTIVPTDIEKLINSPDLPPPIWEASSDFITEKELRKMYGGLASLPAPPSLGTNVTLYWGPQRQDLLRYNRVEALSVGARLEAQRSVAAFTFTGRLGVGDWAPNLEASARRETMRRTTTATVSHGLVAVDDRSLLLGSSVAALFLGRDDGDYYRSTGVSLSFAPPAARAEWYRFTLFAARERSAARETDASLPRLFDGGFDFRPNLLADRADLAGAALSLRGWRGTDPRGWQSGLELRIDGATGDYQYGRAALTARSAFPIAGKWRAALEAGAGSAEGELPAQKQFFLGGAHTLRGYEGAAAVGSTFLRARAELAYTRPEVGVALFSDAGWAGPRNSFHTSNALHSAGVGMTVLDGLVRIDLARALRSPTGWRLELHLDSVL